MHVYSLVQQSTCCMRLVRVILHLESNMNCYYYVRIIMFSVRTLLVASWLSKDGWAWTSVRSQTWTKDQVPIHSAHYNNNNFISFMLIEGNSSWLYCIVACVFLSHHQCVLAFYSSFLHFHNDIFVIQLPLIFITATHGGSVVKNAWRMNNKAKDNKWYIIFARSPEEKRDWLNAFKKEREVVKEDEDKRKHWRLAFIVLLVGDQYFDFWSASITHQSILLLYFW